VRRALVGTALLILLPDLVAAWPAETMIALGRDARRLLPRSLSRLLGERETKIQLELERFPPALGQALARDIPAGELQPETVAALEYEADRAIEMLREGQVSQGLVRMGALLRIPADLSDPVLSGVPEGWPPGVTREYYALLAAHFDQMPVVLDAPKALEVGRAGLPGLWRSLLARSRLQAPVIHRELFREGRLVDHRRLDYRSPAWAVASLSYSRAVTGIAATWLAVWREAQGDLTKRGRAREVVPRDREPGAAAATPGRDDAPAAARPSAADQHPDHPEAQ